MFKFIWKPNSTKPILLNQILFKNSILTKKKQMETLRKSAFIFILFMISTGAYAQVEKYQAAYIFNFAKYVQWPKTYQSTNFVIGVLGNNAKITPEPKKIAQRKKIKGKKIEIKVFSSTSKISKCHILFIPTSNSKYIRTIFNKIGVSNTLIVTHKEGLIRQGSAINFVLRKSKLRFELSKSNAKKQKLKISPTLQKLAIKTY